jgi:hypothetical protein
MDRRHFTRLLALLPLVLLLKPRTPERFNLCCKTCGKYIGHVEPEMQVVREGRTLCAEHSGIRNEKTDDPMALIEGYHIVPRDWGAYRDAYSRAYYAAAPAGPSLDLHAELPIAALRV